MITRKRSNGTVALITGAGSGSLGIGIGSAIAIRLATDGYQIGVLDRDGNLAQATAKMINDEGGKALAVQADVAVNGDCHRAVDSVLDAFGHLDVLVNNVGISSSGTVVDLDEHQWDQVMTVNVKGMMLMTRHVAPQLPAGGSIVNISSTGAFRPSKGRAAYSTSKGAVIALTMSMAVDLGTRGVRVNCVCPGYIWTPMAARQFDRVEDAEALRSERRLSTLLETEGTPADIAHAVAFFASENASWITGQTLTVDGGTGLWRGVPGSPIQNGLEAAVKPRVAR